MVRRENDSSMPSSTSMKAAYIHVRYFEIVSKFCTVMAASEVLMMRIE